MMRMLKAYFEKKLKSIVTLSDATKLLDADCDWMGWKNQDEKQAARRKVIRRAIELVENKDESIELILHLSSYGGGREEADMLFDEIYAIAREEDEINELYRIGD